MRKLLFLISFINLVSTTYSQESSIIKKLDQFENVLYSDKDSALYYINKATQESIACKNNFQYSRCLYKLGYLYFTQNKISEALINTKKSISICKTLNNFKTLSACYNLLGKIKMKEGNYNESLNNLLLALKIAEKNNLSLNTCNALIDLGNLYECQKDTIKALSYYIKNKDISLSNNIKGSLLDSYNNIALLLKKSNKNEAIKNYQKAFLLANELNNKESQFNILINLSEIELLTSLDKCYIHLQKAKEKAAELKDTSKFFYVYFNLGGYYTQRKDFSKAIENYNKAQNLIQVITDKDQIISLYEAMSDCYRLNGDYKNAYLYQSKSQINKNELFNIEKKKTFDEIQTKYDVEKKNLKINLLTKQKQIEQEKKNTLLLLATIISISFILSVLFFKNRIKMQKIIQEKEHQLFEKEKTTLEKDKELNRINGEIQGQDKERNRIAKEIHDGIGGKLAIIKHRLSYINTNLKNKEIKENINHIDSLFKELRTISHNLSSNYLKNNKLEELLFELKKEFQKNYSINIELIYYPKSIFDDLDFEKKLHLYRIIQELLSNIIKHANAKNVFINFTRDEQNINLIVEDDGVGFSNKSNKGIGLKNIEERVTLLQGSFQVESFKEHGSSIIIDFKN